MSKQQQQQQASMEGKASAPSSCKVPSQQLQNLNLHDPAAKSSSVQIGVEAKKADDPAKWYTQVLLRSEMMDYSDISGCYILRPWAYSIWERVQAFLNAKIQASGVDNCYFPMFVSQRALEREKDHVQGFAPEVAWVTRAGSSDLHEPIAIRPTSETVMYPLYAKWIQSYRDLPLRLNQWCNVVRWEFKHPQPFLRTREFLWQEGHTAFLTQKEAEHEVLEILSYYQQVYEDVLAVPVIPGRKSENEKFAGGDYTTTLEAFVPVTGRGIQAATSHGLGQNFAKMFGIEVENERKEKQHVWQNSWGLTTRSLGIMVMVHADDKGLVLPPRAAQVQVILVPCGITAKTTTEGRQAIYSYLEDVARMLREGSGSESGGATAMAGPGIRCKTDLREMYSPGYKFHHWELRGVPIRLEAGPRDLAAATVVLVRRDTGTKQVVPVKALGTTVPQLLDTIHADMLARARAQRDAQLTVMDTWEGGVVDAGTPLPPGFVQDAATPPTGGKGFVAALDDKHLVLAPWCTTPACEEAIKTRSARTHAADPLAGSPDEDDKAPSMGAKSLCIPFNQPKPLQPSTPCFAGCGEKAIAYALFGRSY